MVWLERREFITLLGDAAPKLALRSTPAGMMVRAAPTRGPNGVVCPLRIDASPERSR
jgi:hypothetical protein